MAGITFRLGAARNSVGSVWWTDKPTSGCREKQTMVFICKQKTTLRVCAQVYIPIYIRSYAHRGRCTHTYVHTHTGPETGSYLWPEPLEDAGSHPAVS